MSFKYWLLAIRPKTLLVSLTPLLVGGSLAYQDNGFMLWSPWWLALLAAILIQVGTNLHNDVADYERGADTPERLGPERVTAQHWLSGTDVRRAAHLCFGASFLLGIYLVWVGGWPIVLLGLAAIVAGYGYTGGPKPIAYTPLGELFVLIFFGVAAVAGTYYLQGRPLTLTVLFAGVAVGLPAAAVLLINNYRDLEGDLKVGKRTLVAYLGRRRSRYLYSLMLLLPVVFMISITTDPVRRWFPILTLPLILWLMRQLWCLPIDKRLNRLLAITAQYQLLLGLLYCGALIL